MVPKGIGLKAITVSVELSGFKRVRPKCEARPCRLNKALTRKGRRLKLDLEETPLSKADFSWFSDSSYLEGECCAGM